MATVAVVGLLFSFSQSSFVSLAVGIVVALDVLWRRKAIAPLAVAAAVLALVTLGVPQLRHRVLGKAGDLARDGRPLLARLNGLKIVEHHPLVGVGAAQGGYAEGTTGRRGASRRRRASHTTPITVAAETASPASHSSRGCSSRARRCRTGELARRSSTARVWASV